MTQSALTPEQAMLWVLFDHDQPELGYTYTKEQQASKIVSILADNGYEITRKDPS